MKRIIALTGILLLAFTFAGCKPANAPLPKNAINSVDAGVNETLQSAHAGAAQFAADVQDKKFVPTTAEKAAYDSVVTALNTADPLYQQWHAALAANPMATEPQQLISALSIVTANINSVLTAVGTLK